MTPSVAIVVPHRSVTPHRDRLWGWCRSYWTHHFPDVPIIEADSDPTKPFSRSAAPNEGARRAESEIVVICNSDCWVDVAAVRQGVGAVFAGAPWCVPYSRYRTLTPEATADVLAAHPKFELPALVEGSWTRDLRRSPAGPFIVRRADYLAMGGHDEKFTGWSYEDTAFVLAADTFIGRHRIMNGVCWHLHHEIEEGTTVGSPEHLANRERFRQVYRRNRGRPERLRPAIDADPSPT